MYVFISCLTYLLYRILINIYDCIIALSYVYITYASISGEQYMLNNQCIG